MIAMFLGTSLITEDQLPKVLPEHSLLRIFSGSPLPFNYTCSMQLQPHPTLRWIPSCSHTWLFSPKSAAFVLSAPRFHPRGLL